VLQTPPNSFGVGDDEPTQGNAFINFEHPNGFDINATQRQAIEDWFAEMEDVLFDRTAVDWDDPVDGYAKYIDVDNFIDYYILRNLSKNSDGRLLSMWIYNPDPNNGGKLKFGPPWDHDLGTFEGSPTSSLLHRSDRLWYDRLFDDPAFVQQYEARWQNWRQSILSDAGMNQVFDDFVAEIGNDAFVRDGVTDITSRIDTVKNWLSSRAAAIDNATGGPMTVAFTADQTFGAPPLTVQFTDQSDVDGASAWLWDFGDDNTSTDQNPSHTYTVTGFYDVSLTVTGTVGPLSITSPSFIAAMTAGDVDQNGLLEMADVTQFIAGWRSDTTGLTDTEKIMLGDLNRDGTTNFADWFLLSQAWNAQGGAALDLGSLVATSQGDYNDDGSVDVADFDVWQVSFGQTLASAGNNELQADGNFDGTVNLADYTVWRDHLVQTATAASSAASPTTADSEPLQASLSATVSLSTTAWPVALAATEPSTGRSTDGAFAALEADVQPDEPDLSLLVLTAEYSDDRGIALDIALREIAEEDSTDLCDFDAACLAELVSNV
ncbi:MAG: CotH kinase family protein, partial [Aeoliella sp.]